MSRMNNEEGLGMTDEELTEEYAEVLCQTCTLDTCRHNILQTCAIKESIKQAFLAGLKAGRPKWHKVADGDLPSEEGGWVCNQNGLPCFFDWGTEQWLDCEGTQIRTTEWCHMPHKE